MWKIDYFLKISDNRNQQQKNIKFTDVYLRVFERKMIKNVEALSLSFYIWWVDMNTHFNGK